MDKKLFNFLLERKVSFNIFLVHIWEHSRDKLISKYVSSRTVIIAKDPDLQHIITEFKFVFAYGSYF